MPTLSEILSDSIDGRSRLLRLEEASDLEGTRARIGRGRRIRVAATTSVGVVALAGVTSAAITWGPRLMEPAAPEPGDTATVTVARDELNTDILEALDWQLRCGDPAPTALTSSDGFSFGTVTEATTSEWVTALSTYRGEAIDGVDMRPGYAVLARDGVIQAVLVSQGVSVTSTFDSSGEGLTYSVGFDLAESPQTIDDGWIGPAIGVQIDTSGLSNAAICINGFDLPADGYAVLPAGDYELYVIQSIEKSPVENARRELRERGYTFASEHGTWTPGSLDCDESTEYAQKGWSDTIPVECEPFGVSGVAFDDEGTVTIEYTVNRGPQNLHLTLVSQPVALTLGTDVPVTSPWSGSSGTSSLDASTELACGAPLDTSFQYTELSAEFAGDRSAGLDAFFADAGAAALFDTGTTSAVQAGHLEPPADATAWLIASRAGKDVVVGVAHASVGDGEPLAIDRSKVKAAAMVRLGEPQWCEFPDTGVDGYLKTGDVTAMIIEGEFTGVSDTGATEVTPMVYLDWAHTEG